MDKVPLDDRCPGCGGMWALIGRKHLCSERLRGASAPAKSRGGGESGPARTKVAGTSPEERGHVATGSNSAASGDVRSSRTGHQPEVASGPCDIIPMTDRDAARYVVQTHPITQQADEKPEDFVLRIVLAYDHVKGGLTRGKPKGRPLEKDRSTSLEATKPWEVEGMSRRTWFRRKGKS